MVVVAVDPVNTAFMLLWSYLMYASGFGKVMIEACKANRWGFTRNIKPPAPTPISTEGDRIS